MPISIPNKKRDDVPKCLVSSIAQIFPVYRHRGGSKTENIHFYEAFYLKNLSHDQWIDI